MCSKIFPFFYTNTLYINVQDLATIRGVFLPRKLWGDIIKSCLHTDTYKNQQNNIPENNIPVIIRYNNTNTTNKIKLFEKQLILLVHNTLPLYGFINGISENNQIVYLINMNILEDYYMKLKYEAHIQGLLEIINSQHNIEMDCLLIDIDNVNNTQIIKRKSTYFDNNLIDNITEFHDKINIKK